MGRGHGMGRRHLASSMGHIGWGKVNRKRDCDMSNKRRGEKGDCKLKEKRGGWKKTTILKIKKGYKKGGRKRKKQNRQRREEWKKFVKLCH
jgi:hypothetical protein